MSKTFAVTGLIWIVVNLAVTPPSKADNKEKGCCVINHYLCEPWLPEDDDDIGDEEGGSGSIAENELRCGANGYSFCTQSYELCSNNILGSGAVLDFVLSCQGVPPDNELQCKISEDASKNSLMDAREWLHGQRCERAFNHSTKAIVFRCGEYEAEHKLSRELP